MVIAVIPIGNTNAAFSWRSSHGRFNAIVWSIFFLFLATLGNLLFFSPAGNIPLGWGYGR